MTTIGSGIAGSIAATPLSSKQRGNAAQAEQVDLETKAREMKRLAEAQRREVENLEHAELESVLPDERRQRRRRRDDDDDSESEEIFADEQDDGDQVQLESIDHEHEPQSDEPLVESQARPTPLPHKPPPPDAAPGSILDVEA